MAITNYDELVKAVVKWSKRPDVLTLIPDFIMLAEEAMYNNDVQPLKVRSMETTADLTANERIIALPADYESLRSARFTINGGEVKYVTPEVLNFVSGTDRPTMFTIVGSNVEFDITPDQSYVFRIVYYKKAAALTASAITNEILTNHPSVYLNGAVLEAMIYAQDIDQQQVFRTRFFNSIKGANKADKKGRYGNAPAVRIDGGMRP